MTKAADRNRDQAPLGKKLEDLYELIEGIEIAMFTTRRPDGHLVSRPMARPSLATRRDQFRRGRNVAAPQATVQIRNSAGIQDISSIPA